MPRVGIHDSYNWPPSTYADIVEAEDDACTSLSYIISRFNPKKWTNQDLSLRNRVEGTLMMVGVSREELERINSILCSDIMRELPPEGEGGN